MQTKDNNNNNKVTIFTQINKIMAQIYLKEHKANEFYVKQVRGGYFAVINGYDHSIESLETIKEAAENICKKYNERRNAMLN